ncbi:MAG TPA: DegT/DnrJ/EryC1/StrS family aminotransferase [Nitrososphaerales archaeon]|nr:DegT/DnrJ/EryC1/StrS family aminotransferase [Nitrososphaerales archaeon]
MALYGGKPVREKPLPVMHPGATFFDNAEVNAVLEVLKAQSPYRFYGPNFLNITGKFEVEFKRYVGTTYALAVTSGTAALHTALRGLGIGPGDEVIIPTYSWVACPSAVVATGATPVLANVDESLTLDPDDVERRITNRTKAIMAVHIRGVPCDLDQIAKIAKRYQVDLLEDVAQCGGGSYHGKKLGSIGDIGTFSFQLNKMISAGEGGAVVTNDQTTYERCLMFHDTGTPYRGLEEKELRYSIRPFPGLNYRANEISSAILRVQLTKMDTIIRKIRETKSKIKSGISDIPGLKFRKIPDPEGEVAVGLVFFTESKEKATLFKDALMAENIRTPSGSYPGVVYEPGRNDGHVFMHWGHLLPGIERVSAQYQQTLDLLSRAVHIDISPLDGEQEISDIIEGIRKVSTAIL